VEGKARTVGGEPVESSSSELLGFTPDARVLILNCDDLGMHSSINAAILDAVREGVASSASLMVPSPAAAEAMQLLHHAPDVPFGIHLTLTRDGPGHRWAPVSPVGTVPSLVDAGGLLLTSAEVPQLLNQVHIEDVERELRVQIGVVTRSGLTPTHLDWHVMADGGRADVMELTLDLAREHGLAARVWLEPRRRATRARGLPVVDHDFLDSFALDVSGKTQRFAQLLRDLPIGLNEWAVHPALGEESAAEANLGWAVRRSDYAFLVCPLARQLIEDEGIVISDYRRLQQAWASASKSPQH
jgi:predicted glycoside hydrolase/deacetylase ChbG (UPF0249 family)